MPKHTHQKDVDYQEEKHHVDNLEDVHGLLKADNEEHGTHQEDPILGEDPPDGGPDN